MIQIEHEPWGAMVEHVRSTFPKEGCGILLGTEDGETRTVVTALPCGNAYEGDQSDFFVIDPRDFHRADREAVSRGLSIVGVYHSHPDCDAYFSARDLENSNPWFSFVVLSIKGGEFDHANSYRPDFDQKSAAKEELNLPNEYGKDSHSHSAAPVRG